MTSKRARRPSIRTYSRSVSTNPSTRSSRPRRTPRRRWAGSCGQGIIEAIATTSLLKFLKSKDDVTVTVTREGDATIVNVRSKSHLGKGDLGTNARRIRAFQAELAKRL